MIQSIACTSHSFFFSLIFHTFYNSSTLQSVQWHTYKEGERHHRRSRCSCHTMGILALSTNCRQLCKITCMIIYLVRTIKYLKYYSYTYQRKRRRKIIVKLSKRFCFKTTAGQTTTSLSLRFPFSFFLQNYKVCQNYRFSVMVANVWQHLSDNSNYLDLICAPKL